MKYFNSSGPNIPAEHYTLMRPALVATGMDLVKRSRYFTIWAPRQTGKSTYFRLLKDELEKEGFSVMHVNFENFNEASLASLMTYIRDDAQKQWGLTLTGTDFVELFNEIKNCSEKNLVLIVDEIAGLNPVMFGQFLHTIRNLYHSREEHCLKSTILVGVTNIVGVVQDNASPFNIADNLHVPYFTAEETTELLHQHETETGQLFERKVVKKIHEITAGQPGLVNGFAWQLTSRHPGKPKITYKNYLEVEHWYLYEAIDKNFANILNKAREYRAFLETLLFTETEIPFDIDREAIKALHTNGIIRPDENKKVEFWVPFYKKRLLKAFYPYTNGEQAEISANLYAPHYFKPNGELDLDKLIGDYKAYAARRGFGVFREKDKEGKFTTIKEAGLIYSFETFLASFVAAAEGRSYREADASLGKSDLVLNIRGKEFLFETKKYGAPGKFEKGINQVAWYARSLGLKKAIYLVFTPNHLKYPAEVKEDRKTVKGVEVSIYLVSYDEKKDF